MIVTSTPPLPGLRAVLCWASAAVLVLFGVLWLYAQSADAFVEGLDQQIGEVLLQRALAFESAGLEERAEQEYGAALKARFAGPQNRAMAQARLGALWLEKGMTKEAMPLLRASVDSGRAPLEAYGTLIRALLLSDDLEEAGHMAARWLDTAEQAQDAYQRSLAHAGLGDIALRQGREEEAAAQYAQGNALLPGQRNAFALARLAYERQSYPEALKHLKEVLLSGPDPQLWQEALALGEQVLDRYSP